MANFSLFIGRFHPLIVHLPIGILVFTFLLDLLTFTVPKLKDSLEKTIRIGLIATALTCVIAGISGYLLSTSGGYESATLAIHKWSGIGMAVLSFIAFLVRISNSKPVMVKASRALIALSMFMISVTGHMGGNLTHGDTYLTEYAPEPIKTIMGGGGHEMVKAELPPIIDSVQIFEQVVYPILEKKCIECHSDTKKKGNLSLLTVAAMKKGGASGAAVVPNDAHKSELIKRIHLPRSSKKFMPPNGKEPLSPMEANILEWWIKKGGLDGKTLSEIHLSQERKYLLQAYLGIEESKEKAEEILPEVAPAEEKVIADLAKLGVKVRTIKQGSNLLDVSFVPVKGSTQAERNQQLNLLSKINQQVFWLSFRDCNLTNEQLSQLSGFNHLQKLWLENNALNDSSIEILTQFKGLEYLNFRKNSFSAEGIASINKALKGARLYHD